MKKLFSKLKINSFYETIHHFKNYLLADIFTKALGFISIPVYTRLLTTNDYGIFNVFLSYSTFFTVLLSLNSYSAVGRFFYEDVDECEKAIFLGNSIIISYFFVFINSIIMLIFYRELSLISNLPPIVMLLVIPQCIFAISNSVFIQVNQTLKKSKTIAYANLSRSYLQFILAVLLILLLRKNNIEPYYGSILAMIILGFGYSFYYLYNLKKRIQFRIDFQKIKYILKFSIPLIPYSLSGVLLSQFDKMMINGYIGESDAGLYSFAFNIGMLLYVVIVALNNAWMPKYFEYMNSERYFEHDSDVFKIFNIIVICGIGLVLYGEHIGFLLAPQSYYSALKLIPVIVTGYIFFAVFTLYGRNISFVRKTYFSSIVLIVASTVNIVLNWKLIPIFGYTASAYTTVVSYFVMSLLSILVSSKISKHTFNVKYLLLPIFIFSLSITFNCLHFDNFNIITSLILKTIFYILMIYFIYKYLKYFSKGLRNEKNN